MAPSLPQRIKAFFRRNKKDPVYPRAAVPARRGSREITQAYKENAYFQSVLNVTADGVAGPCWHGYKRLSDLGEVIADPALASAPFSVRQKSIKALDRADELIHCPNSPVIRLLEHPNPHMSGRAMRKLVSQWTDMHGECFLYLEKGRGGALSLYPLPSHWVQLPTEANPYFTILPQAAAPQFPSQVSPRQMIHLKKPDPENPYGRGAGLGLGLAQQLDTQELIDRTQKSIYARGALPVTVVGIDMGQDADEDEVAKQIKALYESNQVGPDNAGKPWFTPGKLTASTINADLKSLETQELQKQIQAYVRMTFNVPPEVMGDLTASNRATAEAAQYHLAEFAILPRLEFIRTELMHKLVPLLDPDLVLEYDDPRPQSYDRVSALMMNGTTAPAFGPNEVRELAGYERDPSLEGQKLLPMPGQTAPSVAAPAALAPAPAANEDQEPAPAFKCERSSGNADSWTWVG